MEQKHLMHGIQTASTVTEALHFVEQQGRLTPLSDLLGRTMGKQALTPLDLAARIDVERSTLYRLLSGERLTTRNVLLRIALALKLTLEETERMLTRKGEASLYERM
jgi:transcriptional regulator with XRE-family HTH domain